METVVVLIDGMTCKGCVANVEKVLLAMDGVSHAQANLEQAQAQITFDANRVQLAELLAAIEEIGFDVKLASIEK